jgi:hypothetical protein
MRATLPSTISKKPESKRKIPPMAAAKFQGAQSRSRKALELYTIAAVIETIRPSPVQKFAERPVEAKVAPIFVSAGSSKFLSLFSNEFST